MFLDLRFNLINISGFFKKRNLWNQLVIYISSSTWFFIIFSIRSLFFVLCWPSVAANSRHHQLNPFVICLLLVVVAPSGGASCFLFLFSCWASPIRQCRWSRQRRINKTQRVRSRHPEKLTHFPCCLCVGTGYVCFVDVYRCHGSLVPPVFDTNERGWTHWDIPRTQN
jgi:hypothetical protein